MSSTERIPLRRRDGSVAAWTTVDADTAVAVRQYRWSLNDSGYAVRVTTRPGRTSSGRCRQQSIRLHREVLGLGPGGPLVDHINGDRLDNRRVNLRTLTLRQSAQNTTGKGGTSRYRGVSWDTRASAWRVQVQIDGEKHGGGRYLSEIEAARAAAAIRARLMPYAVDRDGFAVID